MVLNFEGIKPFFKKRTPEQTITSKKKKNLRLVFAGNTFNALSSDLGSVPYFDKSDGCYSFLNTHTAILNFQLEEGTIIETLILYSGNTVNKINFYGYDDSTFQYILTNAGTNAVKKVNKIVVNNQKLWLEVDSSVGQIKRVELEISN